MNLTAALQTVVGLGLYFLALRLLTRGLDRSVSYRIRTFFYLRGRSPATIALLGLGTTAAVQASSTTIVGAMGLLQSGWITLEQAYIAMLGATVGATVEGWLAIEGYRAAGMSLVGVGGVALMFVRDRDRRVVVEGIVAVGLAFAGLELLVRGVTPVVAGADFLGFLKTERVLGLPGEFTAVLLGAALAMVVQSSGAVAFLVVGLASERVIGVPAGAALVLGATLGTTLTPFLASLDYDLPVRRLAVANVIVKGVAALLGILLFPWVLALCLFPLHRWNMRAPAAAEIAAFHTGFSVLTALFAWPLGAPLHTIVRWIVRGPREDEASAQHVVHRMIAGTPDVALDEARVLVHEMLLETRDLMYACSSALAGDPSAVRQAPGASLDRVFDRQRATTLDLLFAVARRARTPSVREEIGALMHKVGQCVALHGVARRLREHLTSGVDLDPSIVPPWFSQAFEPIRGEIDEFWLDILFSGQRPASRDEALPSERSVAASFVVALHDAPKATASAQWLLECIELLGAAMTLLGALRHQQRLDAGTVNTGNAPSTGGNPVVDPGGPEVSDGAASSSGL